ncbi:hypothetical protein B0O99DRAFT_709648 [Bisporella sp. PMI_857]|nr:hypothetical protein B0O99DRAFT_709648 [Bisporella sp. PMI_857]
MATSIPKTMKGVIIEKNGGVEVLQYKTDLPVPSPKKGEILVKNEFVGVNYIDTYFRTGLYPSSLPSILGREAEGTIVSIPTPQYGLKKGDKVVYMSTSTYAEYTVFPASKASPIPSMTPPGIACAAYLQGLTALTLIHEAGAPINKGDFVLVHSAAGGVGLLLCQLLAGLGVRVIGTASTAEKIEEAKRNGAEFMVNYKEDAESLVEKIKAITPDGEGVKVVFDGTGAGQFENDLLVLKRKGVLVSYGNSGGAVPPFAISRLAGKNIRVLRPTVSGYLETREELEHYSSLLFNAITNHNLNVKIHETYTLKDVARAHTDLEGRKTSGKLLLKL